MNFDSVVFLVEKICTYFQSVQRIFEFLMALSKNVLIGHPFCYRTLKIKLSFHQVIKFKSEFGTAGKIVFTMSGV